LTAERLARLLDASWLADPQLFVPVVSLRSAATRSRWRVDACRLKAALGLYRLLEKKSAQKLEDLVPKYLLQLPVDPYSGQAFRYRISKGEELVIAGVGEFQGPKVHDQEKVRPGQAVLWSTGPDRIDHGGKKHGGSLADDDPRWSAEGLDLIAVAPSWP
jgi:hypothetical protein